MADKREDLKHKPSTLSVERLENYARLTGLIKAVGLIVCLGYKDLGWCTVVGESTKPKVMKTR